MSVEQENEVTVLSNAEEASEQELGFNEVANDVPAENAETETQTDVETEVNEEVQATDEIQAIEQAKDELKEVVDAGGLSKDEARKIYGKIGELNAKIAAMTAAASSTPKLRFNADSFKKITENFDSEFAQNLADDLNSALGVAEAEPAQEQKQGIDIAQLEEKFEKKMQANLLKIVHEDYQEAYKSPEFATWRATLPEAEQEKIEDTWDAAYLSKKFTEFKQWRDKTTQKQENGNERLKNAMQPQGGKVIQKAAITEEDGFNSIAT